MSIFHFDGEAAASVPALASLHREFMGRVSLFHQSWEHHLHRNGHSIEKPGPYSTPGIRVGNKGTLILSAYKDAHHLGDLVWLHSEYEPVWTAGPGREVEEDLIPSLFLSEEYTLWLDRPENEQAYLHVDLVLRHQRIFERWMDLVEIWKLEGYTTDERTGSGITLEMDGRLQLAAYDGEGDLIMTLTHPFGAEGVEEELFPAYGKFPRSAGLD